MTNINLQFHRYEQYQPNGDRATKKTKCYLFRIFLNGFEVARFDQFDGWWIHVKDYNKTLAKAEAYVYGLAAALKIPQPKLIKFTKKIVPQVEQWVEEGEDEEEFPSMPYI